MTTLSGSPAFTFHRLKPVSKRYLSRLEVRRGNKKVGEILHDSGYFEKNWKFVPTVSDGRVEVFGDTLSDVKTYIPKGLKAAKAESQKHAEYLKSIEGTSNEGPALLKELLRL